MADYWVISNFDVEWGGDSLKMFQELSRPNKLLLSNGSPEWCAFSVGYKVLDEIGLFDESFHPAYFEDTDFERRLKNKGGDLEIERSFIPVAHDNSSTLKSGFQQINDLTFVNNASYNKYKIDNEDFSEGKWSIKRRRNNSWD